MSTESHASPTGSSNSSLFGGGGNAGANEPMTQSSPAKPTWAQILNSNPGSNSSNASSSNNNSTANTANNNKTKTVSPSTSGPVNSNASRSGPSSNFYEQQQPSQSSMSWPMNYSQSTSWIIEDESQKHAANPTNSSQQSVDGDHTNPSAGSSGGDGFDRRESSSPASERNKSALPNNSAGNGWPNMQQQHTLNNPSRSNQSGNQWLDMNNMYGTNSSNSAGSFNFPQHSNESNNPSNTWQDSPSGNADTLSSSNTSVINKHKASSAGSSITGGGNDTTINYLPQPKLVEQLGWDEPDIQVTRRPNFDDGTSIWGDPSDLVSVPVKKWTDGSKANLKTVPTPNLPQSTSASAQAAVGGATNTPAIGPSQNIVQRPVSTGNPSNQIMLNEDNWAKQQSPTITQTATPQWNDQPTTSSLDSMNMSQPGSFRNQPNNWNTNSPHPGVSHGEEWFREGVVDTSSWGLQGPTHKVPFDPYDGQIDTSAWGVSGGGGMAGGVPGMSRNRFPNEYNVNENPHDTHPGRIGPYESGPYNEICRPNAANKNSMMNMPNMPPNSSNMQTSSNPFVSRPNPLYPQTSENISRSVNPGGGLSTPPNTMMGQTNMLSPKLTAPSPIQTQNPGVPMPNKPTGIQNHLAQPPTPPSHLTGNGNNPNGGNHSGIHAQIMQQFRLAVQAGLISQDLLNTKLPPHMLQLLQKLFEYQQKFQNFSMQLNDLGQQKQRFPSNVFQNEHDRISKEIQQKKQEMISVQKEIQEAHNKLKQQQQQQQQQQQTGLMNQSSMMNNVGRTGNPDQSRLHQWTRQSNPGGQRSGLFPPPPPGIPPKDWATDNHDSNDNWDQSQTNESNPNNPMGNVDTQIHHQHQASSGAYNDPFSSFGDDIDGPPPFVPGQLWNWKSMPANAEDDPQVTPGSFNMGPKGLTSAMLNLNVGGGADSAFTNAPPMHSYPRQQQSSRSQWQQGFSHDQQGFLPPQYRGTPKPPHPPFGSGYRPYS